MNDVHALDLAPGTNVGGYTLIGRLGAGAMGSVWRAADDGGHVYAMKILRDSLVDDDMKENAAARERLRREAMAMRRIRHPGVCQIVDMELDDAVAFIVTELIDGRNLRDDVAANGRYVGDDLERLASKLIDAVSAVHAAGIVHRDIKPTNVMVAARGPVLVDFGIAMGEGESHVTRTGLVMGTPGFIAPEIIEGAESDEASDWWSVAAVLAFAATGAPVFGAKPMMTVLERAASGNANLVGLPPRTMAAFRAALDPHRDRRCTPDELLEAIDADAMDPDAWRDATAEQPEPVPTVVPTIPPAATPTTSARNAAPAPNAAQTQAQTPHDAPHDAPTPGSVPLPPQTAQSPSQPAETRVMRPFGTGFSAGTEPAEPIAGPATAPLVGAAARVPDDDNPRTLWIATHVMPTTADATAAAPGYGDDADDVADDVADDADPARRESRSDLVVGLAVTALFAIAIITALLGL